MGITESPISFELNMVKHHTHIYTHIVCIQNGLFSEFIHCFCNRLKPHQTKEQNNEQTSSLPSPSQKLNGKDEEMKLHSKLLCKVVEAHTFYSLA